uniref:Uncharacterized protein n=1 Tax=Setaria digitata TaxID=48799 RepID=A0A915PLN4_9BILA
MAAAVIKQISRDNWNCDSKCDISMDTAEKNAKVKKFKFFTWRTVILIAAIIVNSGIPVEYLSRNFVAHATLDCSSLEVCNEKFDVPPLLIISSDGFWNNYLVQNITPAIQNLINCGTHSNYMLPSFPSKTFPNHYTIATGLYPAWHGIVDNRFYDAQKEEFFKKSSRDSGWYLGEPKGTLSGITPDYWMKYDSSVPFTQRVDTVIRWLKLPKDERPTLIQLYFEEPDWAGHDKGPHSQKVRTALLLMDGIINYLTRQLIEEGLIGCINIILLSDHGMQQMEKSKSIAMADYIGKNFSEIFFDGVVARIEIDQSEKKKDANSITNSLISKLKCQYGKNFVVYRKDLVPIRYHYAGPRIGDIIINGRPGISIFLKQKKKDSYDRHGDHGYDNRIGSMRTIFVAIGPDIAHKKKISSFQNVELYNLFTCKCHFSKMTNRITVRPAQLAHV